MLDELTPEQRAKLARGWVWQVGHLPESSKNRVSGYLTPRELTPDLTDPVTADGLLRTARAVWRDESLYVALSLSGRWVLRRIGIGGLSQDEIQVWYGECFDSPPASSLIEAVSFDTEQAALLAAILAAPEAT